MTLEDRALLETFVVDNPELEQLENLLAEFNIFEAVWRKARREFYHSDFLAFLLNPTETHGLSDIFLKKFLIQVLSDANNPSYITIKIDTRNLQDAEIRREWRNIDILILDLTNRLVCAIENKIDTTEHSDQLRRYREIVNREFVGYRALFIYLTPDGEEPSDETYLTLSYNQVADLVDSVCQAYKSTLTPDIYTLMTHYPKMLRRQIVHDSEITKLCRKIYREHRQAIKLIFDHLPSDIQSEMAEELRQLIIDAEDNDLYLYEDEFSKTYIGFYDNKWSDLNIQQGWPEDIAPFYFEFENHFNGLWLYMGVKSSKTPKTILYTIHQSVLAYPYTFPGAKRRLNPRFTTIYKFQILTSKDYEENDFDSLMDKLKIKWHKFLTEDLPAIRQALSEIKWPVPDAPH